MVSGLVIQTRAIDNGKLALNMTAAGAANSIWKGTGTKAQNKPTAKALAMDFLLKTMPSRVEEAVQLVNIYTNKKSTPRYKF